MRFFQAIQEALDSGEYCLMDKWSDRGHAHAGELLGVEDGSRVFVKADVAYKLYREAPGKAPLSSRQGLWAVLEGAGAQSIPGQTRSMGGASAAKGRQSRL